jgi:hypothetical protein
VISIHDISCIEICLKPAYKLRRLLTELRRATAWPQPSERNWKVNFTPQSKAELKASASPVALKVGWNPARIIEAAERSDKNGDDMIELVVSGGGRSLKDWLSGKWSAAKLRSCCEAVGAAYEAGEISQDDFPGCDVQVKISIEKRRGFPDQYRIQDYRAASASSVVNLRRAAE